MLPAFISVPQKVSAQGRCLTAHFNLLLFLYHPGGIRKPSKHGMSLTHMGSGVLSPSEEGSGYHASHGESPLISISLYAQGKRLLRKLDGRILLITCVLYLFACESLHVF